MWIDGSINPLLPEIFPEAGNDRTSDYDFDLIERFVLLQLLNESTDIPS